jgi:hypothetical protein
VTRINCVPAGELSDRHLVAEYRELPRVFGLVRAAVARGERPKPVDGYRLGEGHVRSFYARLSYLVARHAELVAEMRRRGFKVNFPAPDSRGIASEWFGAWAPSEIDLRINRARIKERTRVRIVA